MYGDTELVCLVNEIILPLPTLFAAEEFFKSALASHNKFRAIHNSPPLKLVIKMSKEAKEFAQKLLERGTKNQPMVHEDQLVLQKENEGENLASGGGNLGGLTAHGAIKNW